MKPMTTLSLLSASFLHKNRLWNAKDVKGAMHPDFAIQLHFILQNGGVLQNFETSCIVIENILHRLLTFQHI